MRIVIHELFKILETVFVCVLAWNIFSKIKQIFWKIFIEQKNVEKFWIKPVLKNCANSKKKATFCKNVVAQPWSGFLGVLKHVSFKFGA